MDGTYKAWSNSVYYWNNPTYVWPPSGAFDGRSTSSARGCLPGVKTLASFCLFRTSRFDTTSELRASSTVRLLLRSTTKYFTIEGSNDRKNWKQLDSRSGVVFSNLGEIKSFVCPTTLLMRVPNVPHQGDQEQRGFMDVLRRSLKLLGTRLTEFYHIPHRTLLLRHPGLNHRVKLGTGLPLLPILATWMVLIKLGRTLFIIGIILHLFGHLRVHSMGDQLLRHVDTTQGVTLCQFLSGLELPASIQLRVTRFKHGQIVA